MEPAAPQPFIYRAPAPLLIAGASAAGYWLAHTYESAYLAYFGLPVGLVRVGLNTAIVATGALLSAAIGAFVSTALLTARLKDERVGFTVEATAMVGVFSLLVYDHVTRPGFIVAMLHLLAAIVGVALIAVGVRRYRAWAAKRKTVASEGGWVNPLHAILVPWIGWEGILVAMILYLARGMADIVGTETARREARFLTLQEPAGFIVLRTYDEVVVAASLNRQAHTVGPEIAVLNPKGIVVAKYEELGPLRRAPEPANVPAPPTPPPPPPKQPAPRADSTH